MSNDNLWFHNHCLLLGNYWLVHCSTKQARTYYDACLPTVSSICIGDDRIGFPVGGANKPED